MSKRTKMIALVGVMLVGAFLVYMGVGGFAANTQVVQISAGIPATLSLSISTPQNLGSSLAPGGTYGISVPVQVSSNKTWALTVQKDVDLSSGPNVIPSADLKYMSSTGDARVKGLQGTQIEFSSAPTNVCSGCDRGGPESLNMNYYLTVPWDVLPGTYAANHTYTATQP